MAEGSESEYYPPSTYNEEPDSGGRITQEPTEDPREAQRPVARVGLFYNTVVFIPMVVAMYYHLFPSAPDQAGMRCDCAFHSHLATT